MSSRLSSRSKTGRGRRFFGILIVLSGLLLLIDNEVERSKTAHILAAASSWVEMERPEVLDPSPEGKLIHATDSVTTPDILSDTEFALSCNAVILQRKVEYYQLVETSSSYKDGDDYYTEYNYHRQWTDKPVDSQGFHESDYRKKNFTLMTLDPWKAYASEVRFGAYRLPPELYTQMEKGSGEQYLTFVPVQSLAPEVLRRLNDETCRALGVRGEFVCLHEGRIFLGADPLNPQIGDVRIGYEGLLPDVCSVMAQVRDSTLTVYTPEKGLSFSEFCRGERSAESFIEYRTEDNRALAWGLRITTLILLLIGVLLYRKGRQMKQK